MCYSPEVSIGTFLFVGSICLFAWCRHRAASLIFLTIVFMQLIEYILWINPTCNMYNQIASSFVPILLYLQPLLISLIISTMNAGDGFFTKYIFYTLSILFLPFLYLLDSYGKFNNCIVASCGHLDWNIDDLSFLNYFYYLLMIYLFFILKDKMLRNIFLSLSFIFFVYTKMFYKNTFGSVWCFLVNIASVLALVLR